MQAEQLRRLTGASDGSMYDGDQFAAALTRIGAAPAADIARTILNEVDRFAGGHEPEDAVATSRAPSWCFRIVHCASRRSSTRVWATPVIGWHDTSASQPHGSLTE